MSKHRNNLPQLGDDVFLTDGGMETTLVFHQGLELPCFAAFYLLLSDQGIETLRNYYQGYLRISQQRKCGFILETPTWRASPDWIQRVDCGNKTLSDINRRAIGLMLELREEHEAADMPIVVSGNIGPRGDGYLPGERMDIEQARKYHSPQLQVFAQTDADMTSALTLNYTEEAIGATLAARDAGIPIAISFTVETDGRLPDGSTLEEAITRTDEATGGFTSYFMINCAHPAHFSRVLSQPGAWRERVAGIRANASAKSHAELDGSTTLDEGDPWTLGCQYRQLQEVMPWLRVLGGCCGTDQRHIESIADHCL